MASPCSENSSVYFVGRIFLLIVLLFYHLTVVACNKEVYPGEQEDDSPGPPPEEKQNVGKDVDGIPADVLDQIPEGGDIPENVKLPPGMTLPPALVFTTTNETVKPQVFQKQENTPLPDWEVEELKKVEVGVYDNMDKEFQYINDQNFEIYQGKRHGRKRPVNESRDIYDVYTNNERCYDDYIKCTLAAPYRVPVCAVFRYRYRQYKGMWNYQSYCDVFYENCRLRQRSWRVVDNGKCFFDDYYTDFKSAEPTRRGYLGTFVNNLINIFRRINQN